MELTFAIIGCGLTGTSTFCQFIRNLREKADGRHLAYAGIRIAVVEKENFFGPGFPFSDEFVMACHMTNTYAEEMGIEPDDPRGFKEWAESEYGRPASRYKAFPKTDELQAASCTYYPRAVMGEYLRARFMESVETARGLGCRVSLYPRCEVVEAAEKGERLNLRIKELEGGGIFSWRQTAFCLLPGIGSINRRMPAAFPRLGLRKPFWNISPPGASVAVLG